MTLKDILVKPCKIQWRTNGICDEDIYCGDCEWDGENLISLDGDDYDLNDKIYAYRWDEYGLTYWTTCNWMGNQYINVPFETIEKEFRKYLSNYEGIIFC